MSEVTRPILRYYGGKWMAAPHILRLLPAHRIYVEPYSGGASVLLRKARCYCEVYNDLCGEVVNLFRVVRDQGADLVRLLELTPFARDEYYSAFPRTQDRLEMARRTVVRAFMGFGANSINRKVRSGFRANAVRSGTVPANDWRHYPEELANIIERMRGVVIENKDAFEVMRTYDGPETLFYCDPPYLMSTRGRGRKKGTKARESYHFEMDDQEHRDMAAVVRSLKGKVIVSGYSSPLYAELFQDWHQEQFEALADGARERTECLWMNFKPEGMLL